MSAYTFPGKAGFTVRTRGLNYWHKIPCPSHSMWFPSPGRQEALQLVEGRCFSRLHIAPGAPYFAKDGAERKQLLSN